jgi:hypothetical protein
MKLSEGNHYPWRVEICTSDTDTARHKTSGPDTIRGKINAKSTHKSLELPVFNESGAPQRKPFASALRGWSPELDYIAA